MSLSCREDRMMICGIVLRQHRNVTDVYIDRRLAKKYVVCTWDMGCCWFWKKDTGIWKEMLQKDYATRRS